MNRLTGILPYLCATKRRMRLCAVCMGLVLAMGCAVIQAAAYAEQTQEGIANGIIRLHIPAHSDSVEDQNVKLLVKNRVLSILTAALESSKDKSGARAVIESELLAIEAAAAAVLAENGLTYTAQAEMARGYFPTKKYGDISLPAGVYDSLRITLGEGAGQNWWCMVFPPLCYIDITQAETDPALREELEALLTQDGAALVMQSDEPGVRVRFKLVEIWNEWRNGWGI